VPFKFGLFSVNLEIYINFMKYTATWLLSTNPEYFLETITNRRKWKISGLFRKSWNKSSTSWPICLNKISRSYIDSVKLPGKFRICMSFHWLIGKVFPLEPYFEATRNFPGPKKIPRAYFSLLNMCSRLYRKILTLSAPNPQAKTPQRRILDMAGVLDFYFSKF
jgi:hypothetical protein